MPIWTLQKQQAKTRAALCHLNSGEEGGQTFRGWNLNQRRRNQSRGPPGAPPPGVAGWAGGFGDRLEEHLELLTHFHNMKGIQPPNGKPKGGWLPYEVQAAFHQDFHSQPLCQLLRTRSEFVVKAHSYSWDFRLHSDVAGFSAYIFFMLQDTNHITFSI